ncbi:MAG TPA: hypothetical protein VFN49_11860 [Candidatus Aquilonibacter sp.]|nr:hypothetical protein [Candidatus Aquilonibacter sp.]
MIGLVLAATIGAGSYTYHASYHGADLGTSKITVTNTAGATQIAEQTSGAYSGASASGNATLVLNPDLSPSSYRASGTMAGNPIADSATVSGNTARVTNAQGASSSFTLTGGASHFVLVDLGTLAGFVALPAQMKAWNSPTVMAVIPSFGQSLTLQPEASVPQTRPSGVPAADVGMSFGGHTPFTMWYNPTTLIPDEIEIPSQSVVITKLGT